jgi:hypothetical protein
MKEQKQEITTEKNSTVTALSMFLIISLSLLLFNIYTNDHERDNLKDENEALKESHYEFQKMTIIANAEILTKKIKSDFPNIEEFRIVSFYGDSKDFTISTIIGEPIIDDRTSIGYNYDNLYLIKAKIGKNKLEFLNIYRANFKADLKQKETARNSSFLSKAVDFVIKISDYVFPGFQIEKNRATFAAWVKDFNNLIIRTKRESIEKPILLIRTNKGTIWEITQFIS